MIHRKDVKKIIATVIEVGVIVTMTSHLYQFNGEVFNQLLGGPIGLRLTAVLANLVMAYYDMTLKKLMTREGVHTNISFRFVDDSRYGLRPIRPGFRWNNGGIVYNSDWVEEDILIGPQRRTTEVINKMLNSVVEYLTFTTEDQLDYDNLKLPTLDCQLWVQDEKIYYEFYEKPQVPNRVLQYGTALSSNSLEASLTQEGVRRLLNTSPEVSTEVKASILNEYARKLLNSGHGVDFIKMILIQACVCYQENCRRDSLQIDHPEYKPLYLAKDFKKRERMLQKRLAKTNWFKKSGKCVNNWRINIPKAWRPAKFRQRRLEGIDITTVMIVPNTDKGVLLDSLIKKEAQLAKLTGYCVKLVEGNGTPLARVFPTPLTQSMCHRLENCEVCKFKDKGRSNCQTRNVVYTAECIEVVSDQNNDQPAVRTCIDKLYIGETSRSLSERAAEHSDGGIRLDVGNFVTKHWLEAHSKMEKAPTFRFKVKKVHRDPLSRELHEAVLIEKANTLCGILNSKNEWSSGTITRLSVKLPDWEIKKASQNILDNEKEEKTDMQNFQASKKENRVTFDKAIKKLSDRKEKQDIRSYFKGGEDAIKLKSVGANGSCNNSIRTGLGDDENKLNFENINTACTGVLTATPRDEIRAHVEGANVTCYGTVNSSIK